MNGRVVSVSMRLIEVLKEYDYQYAQYYKKRYNNGLVVLRKGTMKIESLHQKPLIFSLFLKKRERIREIWEGIGIGGQVGKKNREIKLNKSKYKNKGDRGDKWR